MKPVIFKEASKIWTKVSFGDDVVSKEFELEVKKKFLNIFQVGDFYYFILNIKNLRLDFMSEESLSVLGYQPQELDLQIMFSLIHPEDQPWFLNFESKVAVFLGTLSPEQIPNYKFRYDYRIRKKNGEYIRILQQVITLDYSSDGGILKTLGVHTDISHIKMTGKPVLSFIGMNGEPSFIDIDAEKIFPTPSEFLSRRENEILTMLVNGKKSQQIADELFISKSTVSTHRKNILKKTNAKNTNDLIAMAIKNGWV